MKFLKLATNKIESSCRYEQKIAMSTDKKLLSDFILKKAQKVQFELTEHFSRNLQGTVTPRVY